MKMGDEPYDRTGYETLDYMLVPDRWNNSIKNIESDIHSGISSDHCPLWPLFPWLGDIAGKHRDNLCAEKRTKF